MQREKSMAHSLFSVSDLDRYLGEYRPPLTMDPAHVIAEFVITGGYIDTTQREDTLQIHDESDDSSNAKAQEACPLLARHERSASGTRSWSTCRSPERACRRPLGGRQRQRAKAAVQEQYFFLQERQYRTVLPLAQTDSKRACSVRGFADHRRTNVGSACSLTHRMLPEELGLSLVAHSTRLDLCLGIVALLERCQWSLAGTARQ